MGEQRTFAPGAVARRDGRSDSLEAVVGVDRATLHEGRQGLKPRYIPRGMWIARRKLHRGRGDRSAQSLVQSFPSDARLSPRSEHRRPN